MNQFARYSGKTTYEIVKINQRLMVRFGHFTEIYTLTSKN